MQKLFESNAHLNSPSQASCRNNLVKNFLRGCFCLCGFTNLLHAAPSTPKGPPVKEAPAVAKKEVKPSTSSSSSTASRPSGVSLLLSQDQKEAVSSIGETAAAPQAAKIAQPSSAKPLIMSKTPPQKKASSSNLSSSQTVKMAASLRPWGEASIGFYGTNKLSKKHRITPQGKLWMPFYAKNKSLAFFSGSLLKGWSLQQDKYFTGSMLGNWNFGGGWRSLNPTQFFGVNGALELSGANPSGGILAGLRFAGEVGMQRVKASIFGSFGLNSNGSDDSGEKNKMATTVGGAVRGFLLSDRLELLVCGGGFIGNNVRISDHAANDLRFKTPIFLQGQGSMLFLEKFKGTFTLGSNNVTNAKPVGFQEGDSGSGTFYISLDVSFVTGAKRGERTMLATSFEQAPSFGYDLKKSDSKTGQLSVENKMTPLAKDQNIALTVEASEVKSDDLFRLEVQSLGDLILAPDNSTDYTVYKESTPENNFTTLIDLNAVTGDLKTTINFKVADDQALRALSLVPMVPVANARLLKKKSADTDYAVVDLQQKLFLGDYGSNQIKVGTYKWTQLEGDDARWTDDLALAVGPLLKSEKPLYGACFDCKFSDEANAAQKWIAGVSIQAEGWSGDRSFASIAQTWIENHPSIAGRYALMCAPVKGITWSQDEISKIESRSFGMGYDGVQSEISSLKLSKIEAKSDNDEGGNDDNSGDGSDNQPKRQFEAVTPASVVKDDGQSVLDAFDVVNGYNEGSLLSVKDTANANAVCGATPAQADLKALVDGADDLSITIKDGTNKDVNTLWHRHADQAGKKAPVFLRMAVAGKDATSKVVADYTHGVKGLDDAYDALITRADSELGVKKPDVSKVISKDQIKTWMTDFGIPTENTPIAFSDVKKLEAMLGLDIDQTTFNNGIWVYYDPTMDETTETKLASIKALCLNKVGNGSDETIPATELKNDSTNTRGALFYFSAESKS